MKAKREKTEAGSFPDYALHRGLSAKAKKEWQVLCGDKAHWRVGFYSPTQKSNREVERLEKHTCVELFMLLSGRMTLILDNGKREYELKLEPMKPVMVWDWHCGYCPTGSHAGVAIVVERDQFSTVYQKRRGRG
jgi:hypothetical protein